MKISVFQSFGFHYEMLGYLIDFFNISKINADFYLNTFENSKSWKKHYENVFNMELEWKSFELFNPDDYDLIILLTDDDNQFKEEWIEKHGSIKVICIDHHYVIRRHKVLTRIGTRFFCRRPNSEWALPCYQALTKDKKKELIEKNEKIIVSCIGEKSIPPSDDFLKKLFINFDDIIFYVINRKIEKTYESSNIIAIENCETERMNEIIRSSNYLITFNLNSDCIFNSMSAAIPNALNNGCQLIIPEDWQKFYNLKSALTYKDNILQNHPEITALTLSKNHELDKVYNELYNFVSHKNRVFDRAIKILYPFYNDDKPYNSWYGKLHKLLNFPVINVYLESEINDLQEVKEDFLEIHHINSNNESNNNELSNAKHIYLHYGESINIIEKLIYQITEPIIFSLNCSSKNFLEELKLIGKRGYIDLIIINNATYYEDIRKVINDNYNRYHMIYNVEDPTKIIILPQK
jgi:hypothetical protein